ncbi:hypothetical protein [Streptomyces sp. NPDC002187]|uniref:hypothetical protein n=1 Tax=Streptomyces sp. NPDC002187 TaxID=3364637 RepID=UPI0036A1A150
MGIWTDAFIAPAEPNLLSREAFGRLVVELARQRVVRTPWTLIAGTLCVNASLNWGSVSGQARWDRAAPGTLLCSDEVAEQFQDNDPPPWGDSHEQARLLARGEAILDVLPALQQAPYGDKDVAVVFDCLDFGNRAVVDYFRFEDHRTMLVCFALARPQNRPLSTNDCGPPADRSTRCAPASSTRSSTRRKTVPCRKSPPSLPATSAPHSSAARPGAEQRKPLRDSPARNQPTTTTANARQAPGCVPQSDPTARGFPSKQRRRAPYPAVLDAPDSPPTISTELHLRIPGKSQVQRCVGGGPAQRDALPGDRPAGAKDPPVVADGF